MLNLMKFGSPEPRFASTTMQKGGYHTCAVHSLLGNCLNPIPIGGKPFPYMKPTANLSVHNTCHNCPPTIVEETQANSSSMTQDCPKTGKVANGPNYACNTARKKRRKKKRRSRRKNKNQNQQWSGVTQMNGPSRERTMSVDSEDSFVIFFNDDVVSEASDCDTITEDFDSLDSVIPNKKVRFASANKLCEVHTMVVWSYAYQAARKGKWEEHARDRDRFRKRIRNTEALIGHVFAAEHRSRIYDERFSEIL